MYRYSPAHHQRLKDVGLQLLDGDDEPQGDECVNEALGQQCHHDGEESGEHRPDQGDERAEEHQRCQGKRQWHADDRQAGADADSIDECDEEGRPDIADQRSEPGPPGIADPVAGMCGNDRGQVGVNVATAV